MACRRVPSVVYGPCRACLLILWQLLWLCPCVWPLPCLWPCQWRVPLVVAMSVAIAIGSGHVCGHCHVCCHVCNRRRSKNLFHAFVRIIPPTAMANFDGDVPEVNVDSRNAESLDLHKTLSSNAHLSPLTSHLSPLSDPGITLR